MWWMISVLFITAIRNTSINDIFTLQKSSYNGRPAQVEHMWDRVCDSAQCRLDIFFIENGSFLQKLSVFDKIIVNLALRAESRKKKMYTKIMM
jgi:hypothetical protein